MRQYERLFEQKRNSRRTIADALDVLCKEAGFAKDDRAQIRIGLLQLPSSDVVGLVQIFFDAPSSEKGYVVSLPTSAQFYALRMGSLLRDRFDIAQLDEAVLDGTGNVLPADGVILRAVEVIPAHLPLESSVLEWRIVHHTISMIGAEQRCYRRLRDGLPARFQDMVPDLQFLDCSTLSGLDVPPLKAIAAYIADRDWTLKKLSQQKIADALRTFGIRVPTSRPRVTIRHGSAAI